MKLFKSLLDIISWLSIGVMVTLAIFTISSNGTVFNGYRSFMVLSGSMEPTIGIGSIILVHHQNQYQIRDVVTFETEGRVVTHRIAEQKKQKVFITKGDANRSEDDGQVNQESVIGKVVLTIPFLGRFMTFAQSPFGLILFILIPSLGLIVDQIIHFQDAKRQN